MIKEWCNSLIHDNVESRHIRIYGHKLFVTVKLHGVALADGFSSASFDCKFSQTPSSYL